MEKTTIVGHLRMTKMSLNVRQPFVIDEVNVYTSIRYHQRNTLKYEFIKLT